MPFYRVSEIPFPSLRAEDDLFGRIFRRDLEGVLVRGFLPAERARAIVGAIEAGAFDVPRRRFAREFEAYSIGPCLDQAESGTAPYFDAVPGFARAAADLFAGDPDPERHFDLALSALAGARPLVHPRDPDGRGYGRFTLRRLPPGGCIPPHAENEQLQRPPYAHLRELLDESVIVSFYLTLAPADEGGELAVYDFGWDERDPSAVRARHSDVGSALERRERFTMKPLAGDLIVFDGGRRFHEVLPVRGNRDRWTMGGFLALSRDGQSVLSWA